MTLLSRVLGLVRDVVLAGLFGASGGADAFVAFKIQISYVDYLVKVPLLRLLFRCWRNTWPSPRALKQPLERWWQPRPACSWRSLQHSQLRWSCFQVCGLGVCTGFADDPVKMSLAGELLGLTFPYLFFIAGVAFAGAILNAHDRFAVPAFTPVL